MKFKKWTISNKYGIPQIKMWSIEQPVKEDENSNFSTFDKEVSMYRFIAPNLINLSKDLCKNFKIAISIYVCSLTVLACVSLTTASLLVPATFDTGVAETVPLFNNVPVEASTSVIV